jgi:hypothetical protein
VCVREGERVFHEIIEARGFGSVLDGARRQSVLERELFGGIGAEEERACVVRRVRE